MQHLSGFVHYDSNLVCKLQVTYGFKKAPRSWFHKLSEILIILGFNPIKSDSSLFTKF